MKTASLVDLGIRTRGSVACINEKKPRNHRTALAAVPFLTIVHYFIERIIILYVDHLNLHCSIKLAV